MQKISDTQCSGRQPAAANSLEQNPGNSSVPRPASNAVSFHVWTVPGVCPAKPQTMSGLSGAPSGTASQTI